MLRLIIQFVFVLAILVIAAIVASKTLTPMARNHGTLKALDKYDFKINDFNLVGMGHSGLCSKLPEVTNPVSMSEFNNVCFISEVNVFFYSGIQKKQIVIFEEKNKRNLKEYRKSMSEKYSSDILGNPLFYGVVKPEINACFEVHKSKNSTILLIKRNDQPNSQEKVAYLEKDAAIFYDFTYSIGYEDIVDSRNNKIVKMHHRRNYPLFLIKDSRIYAN